MLRGVLVGLRRLIGVTGSDDRAVLSMRGVLRHLIGCTYQGSRQVNFSEGNGVNVY